MDSMVFPEEIDDLNQENFTPGVRLTYHFPLPQLRGRIRNALRGHQRATSQARLSQILPSIIGSPTSNRLSNHVSFSENKPSPDSTSAITEETFIQQHSPDDIDEQIRRETEDRTEMYRLQTYNKHRELIRLASHHTFNEINRQLEHLPPLTNPELRFENSLKQGLPDLHTETIFLAILANTKLLAMQKYHLIMHLINNLGYAPYIKSLFHGPTFDTLIQDIHIQELLFPLYILGKFTHNIMFSELNEELIWEKFIEQNIWINVFKYFLARDKFLSAIELTLKALDYNYQAVINLCYLAELENRLMMILFEYWSSALDAHPIILNLYELFLSNYLKHPEFDFHPRYVRKMILQSEYKGHLLYILFEHNNLPTTGIIKLLSVWSTTHTLPHDFSAVKNYYLKTLAKQANTSFIEGEENIWQVIIKSNPNHAADILQHLHCATHHKLWKFIDCWMSCLESTTDITTAFHNIVLQAASSKLNDILPQANKIKELRLQQLFIEEKMLPSEITSVKNLLKNSHPQNLFFSCFGKKNLSYRIFKLIEKNDPKAAACLADEKKSAEEDFSQKIKQLEQKPFKPK